MDPISILGLLSIGMAVLSDMKKERSVHAPQWLFDALWERFKREHIRIHGPPSHDTLVRWDKMTSENMLPYNMVLPGMDITLIADLASESWDGETMHFLTEGELGWLNRARGRYAIADVIAHDTELFEGPDGKEIHIWFIEELQVRTALAADGVDRAPMLADHTLLQEIVFSIGPDEEYEEDPFDQPRVIANHARYATEEAIEALQKEATNCRRTQSWNPSAIRSRWGDDVQTVADAAEALATALETGDQQAITTAETALENAVHDAEDTAAALAIEKAELEIGSVWDQISSELEDEGSDIDEIIRLHQGVYDDMTIEIRRDGQEITITARVSSRSVYDDHGPLLDPLDGAASGTYELPR